MFPEIEKNLHKNFSKQKEKEREKKRLMGKTRTKSRASANIGMYAKRFKFCYKHIVNVDEGRINIKIYVLYEYVL